MNGIITWSPGMTLGVIEKLIILEAFRFFRFNKTATASSLGIAIRTLDNKLSQYEMEDKVEQERQDQQERKRQELLQRARGNPPNNVGIPYNAYTIPEISNSWKKQTFTHDSSPGSRVESIANSSEKQVVSLHEREEIQALPSEQVATSNKKRGRPKLA